MKPIQSALISVFNKEGLEPIVKELDNLGVKIYSTGGTQAFIEKLGIKVHAVESLTDYPSILDGRVKTLHPKVFGGILARREEDHLAQLQQYDIPEIDVVIVNLYPFEQTVAATNDEKKIIEKIDIGGISLIRAAAKNYNDVVVVPSRDSYATFLELLQSKKGHTELKDRQLLAKEAFAVSSHYDTAIYTFFLGLSEGGNNNSFKYSSHDSTVLRYGENPHQEAAFYGNLEEIFEQLNGKPISFNNLTDIDAAVNLMEEFKDAEPTFAVLKHTNACGLASRDDVFSAWEAALAGDPLSAFGGILISNTPINKATAEGIDKIFYEVLIAPDFDAEALELLMKKKKRILLKQIAYPKRKKAFKSMLNGVVQQDIDKNVEQVEGLKNVTKAEASEAQISDLIFANIAVKHLKSNAIALVKNKQIIGIGCGQTSRVDAVKQCIDKAKRMGFDPKGAALASDAFFPFPDSIEIASNDGVNAFIQPGGSIKDQDSIDYCDNNDLAMVFTGTRHFKH